MSISRTSRLMRRSVANPSRYTPLFSWGLRAADLVAIGAMALLAYQLRFGDLLFGPDYGGHIGRGVLFALLVFSASPLYRSWRGRGLLAELWTMLVVYTGLFTLLVVYAVAFKVGFDVSRLWVLLWFGGAVGVGGAARVGVRVAANWTRRNGMDLRTAVIVGDADTAHRLSRTLLRHDWAGIRPLGWFEAADTHTPSPSLPRLGGMDKLAHYVETQRVSQVWVALPMSAEDQIARVLQELAHSTVDIRFVPNIFGLQLLNHSVEMVAGLPVINLRSSPLDADARLFKSIQNWLLALLITVLISPLMLVIAIAVKLSSRGPVLFKQKRHGLGGREIEVWKFRTMHVHAEHAGQVTQASRNDSRITPLGRFLRRTSLDELPQFFNVLQGTMSVVGPRPHAVAHNHQYKTQVQDYMQRHRIKPGITGWAQVNGLRGETDTLDKMAARVEYDLYYMQNWSPGFDLKIIALTLVKGFMAKNAY